MKMALFLYLLRTELYVARTLVVVCQTISRDWLPNLAVNHLLS